MREQVCKYMCPYARFQSALIDMDSMVIAYDTKRGENRGARSRKADPKALGLGDCIDCTLCVQVCPTGIDIRNGLQNECIACAACIDVCDEVMDKMGYAPGLIRYSSGNGIEQGWTPAHMLRRIWRPRVLIYATLLLALGSAFIWSVGHRSDYDVAVSRDRGALARQTGNGDVENTYQLQVTNSLEQPQGYTVRVSGQEGLRLDTAAGLSVGATSTASMPVRLVLPLAWAQRHGGETLPVVFQIEPDTAGAHEPVQVKSTFVVPRY
jgi:cytochrome c oxidase accessory protein FixG